METRHGDDEHQDCGEPDQAERRLSRPAIDGPHPPEEKCEAENEQKVAAKPRVEVVNDRRRPGERTEPVAATEVVFLVLLPGARAQPSREARLSRSSPRPSTNRSACSLSAWMFVALASSMLSFPMSSGVWKRKYRSTSVVERQICFT